MPANVADHLLCANVSPSLLRLSNASVLRVDAWKRVRRYAFLACNYRELRTISPVCLILLIWYPSFVLRDAACPSVSTCESYRLW